MAFSHRCSDPEGVPRSVQRPGPLWAPWALVGQALVGSHGPFWAPHGPLWAGPLWAPPGPSWAGRMWAAGPSWAKP